MRRWITTWLWDSVPEDRGETILAIDTDRDAIAAFGTWLHRDVILAAGRERAIEVAWFGVVTGYQHQRTTTGDSIASTLFVTVEDRARSDPSSTPDMPLVLEVDADNTGAQGFWEHLGFEFLEWAEVASDRYLRMIRSASD